MRHHKLSWHGADSNASTIYCATLNSGADGKTCICHTVPHSILMQMVVHLSYTVPHSILVQMVIHLSVIYCATLNSGVESHQFLYKYMCFNKVQMICWLSNGQQALYQM